MEDKPKMRRPRGPEIARYVPPKARAPGEQRKIPQPIIGVVEATVHHITAETTKLPESTTVKQPRSKRNCQQKTAGRPQFTPKPKHAEPSDQSVNEPEELVKVELDKRTIGALDVPNIDRMIRETDVVIVSSEGQGFPTNVELLKCTSPYFACMLRDKWRETKKGVIQTKVSKVSLGPVVAFLVTGEIRLTISNVKAIFEVAEYFQIECLVESCQNFILSRINLLYRKAILLGAKHRTMAAVAEKAFDYLCENVLSITDEFISMEPIYLTAILSRDELNVGSEDQVCDLVLQWLDRGQDDQAIRQVLDCVRLPHLSRASFERLCEAVGKTSDLPFVDLVKSAKFIELPDDQLARRLFYNRHIHAIWKHSDTLYVQRTVECGVNTEFRIECIQCNNERVVSEDLLQSFSDIRQHHTNFELLPIMNTLYMVTHKKPYDYVLIFQMQSDGRWIQYIKYKRRVAMPDFSASVDGCDLHLCIFDGFNNPLKMLLLQPVAFSNVQDVDYTAPFKMHFSPPKMLFHEDLAIFMLDTTIKICDRNSADVATVSLETDKARNIVIFKRRFTDILRYEDTLYAYGELVCSHEDDSGNPMYDR